jgi:autoinducer 2-degrading protein
MHVTLVHVRIHAHCLGAFIEATRLNHEASIREPGNLRFDILQDPEDETHFILYEAYGREGDAQDHKQTAHYLTWRETVADMMAEPRKGVPMCALFPQ